MPRTAHRLAFFALLTVMVSLAYGINYMYLSGNEHAAFGPARFWHEDTLSGPIRANDTIFVMEHPVFYDALISTANNLGMPDGYYDWWWDYPPTFNAPEFPIPETAERIRQWAFDQGFYFNAGPNMQAWARIREDTLRISWAEVGAPFDSLDYEDVLLPDSAVVFFDSPLRISGTVSTILIVGASGRVGLEDNILYIGSPLPAGQPAPGHPEKFALVSESEIKILNTEANGRENGCNLPEPPADSSTCRDIALNGIYVALNESFTFENQNDPDSGYVCDCFPDERGRLYLWGSLMQKQRGYVHRATQGGTGYKKWYRYDNDLRYWDFGLFDTALHENDFQPLILDFGNVLVGDSARDTVRIFNDFIPITLDDISSGLPIFRCAESDTLPYLPRPPDWEKGIEVVFMPIAAGDFFDTLRFRIPYYDRWFSVPVHGLGITTAANDPLIPDTFAFSVFPNPFNASATISYLLPTPGAVELTLFDVLGQVVRTDNVGRRDAGPHTLRVVAADLPSGIYFARLKAAERTLTQKLLLIK